MGRRSGPRRYPGLLGRRSSRLDGGHAFRSWPSRCQGSDRSAELSARLHGLAISGDHVARPLRPRRLAQQSARQESRSAIGRKFVQREASDQRYAADVSRAHLGRYRRPSRKQHPLLFSSLQKQGCPPNCTIFEKGKHGLGLGPRDLDFSNWPERCLAWMKTHNILPSNKK